MTDQVSISGPVRVDLQSDSAASVAYQLMLHIGSGEDLFKKDQAARQQYFLALYRQCYKAASGHPLESILQSD